MRLQFEDEGPQLGNYSDFGRAIEYGNRAKRKKHFTPDSIPQRIIFDDDDKALAEMDANNRIEDWEGEHRQTEERPSPIIPFDPDDDGELATEGGSYD